MRFVTRQKGHFASLCAKWAELLYQIENGANAQTRKLYFYGYFCIISFVEFNLKKNISKQVIDNLHVAFTFIFGQPNKSIDVHTSD